MQEIIKYIPVSLGEITEEQFIKDYKGIVRKALNEARSYVQSEGKKAAKGKELFYILSAHLRKMGTKHFFPLLLWMCNRVVVSP